MTSSNSAHPVSSQKTRTISRFRCKLVASLVFLVAIMTFHPLEFDLVLFDFRQ